MAMDNEFEEVDCRIEVASYILCDVSTIQQVTKLQKTFPIQIRTPMVQPLKESLTIAPLLEGNRDPSFSTCMNILYGQWPIKLGFS